jgi:DNA-binding transcriptional ArsR family regulator
MHKNKEFSKEDLELAKYLKALSHPARISIMKQLASSNTCFCGEIVEVLPLSQSTVSQHLKELKEAGLVKGEIEGAKVCYCIDHVEWQKAIDAISSFLNSNFHKKIECC